jgi:hypothetical protein
VKVLCTTLFNESHTAENLCDLLEGIFFTFGIRRKVVAICIDNAANMVAACKLLDIPHMPCFTHSLNLVINAGKASQFALINMCSVAKQFLALYHQ